MVSEIKSEIIEPKVECSCGHKEHPNWVRNDKEGNLLCFSCFKEYLIENNLEFAPEELEPKKQEIKKSNNVQLKNHEMKQKSLLEFLEHHNKISINNIIIDAENRRQLDPSNIESLAESIKINGLINPITITKDKQLVAGWHRIEAFKILGRDKIPFVYTNKTDPLELRLQQIDENIIRGQLTTLEECLQLKERKEIYEKLYPETKKGSYSKYAERDSKGRIIEKPITEKISVIDKKSFTQDTAEKTNKSDRTIQMKIKIADNLTPEIIPELLETKMANRQIDLERISKLELEKQKELLKTVKQMKSQNEEIKNLDKLLLQKNEIEKKKQKETFSEIIRNYKEKLEKVKDYLNEKILEYDFEAYQFVKTEDGVIDYNLKYKKLQNTDLWRKGKRLKYELNKLNDIKQPKWNNTALHHENPIFWEHIFSEGIIIEKNEHGKGGALLK